MNTQQIEFDCQNSGLLIKNLFLKTTASPPPRRIGRGVLMKEPAAGYTVCVLRQPYLLSGGHDAQLDHSIFQLLFSQYGHQRDPRLLAVLQLTQQFGVLLVHHLRLDTDTHNRLIFNSLRASKNKAGFRKSPPK